MARTIYKSANWGCITIEPPEAYKSLCAWGGDIYASLDDEHASAIKSQASESATAVTDLWVLFNVKNEASKLRGLVGDARETEATALGFPDLTDETAIEEARLAYEA